jgi:hypothetical protein
MVFHCRHRHSRGDSSGASFYVFQDFKTRFALSISQGEEKVARINFKTVSSKGMIAFGGFEQRFDLQHFQLDKQHLIERKPFAREKRKFFIPGKMDIGERLLERGEMESLENFLGYGIGKGSEFLKNTRELPAEKFGREAGCFRIDRYQTPGVRCITRGAFEGGVRHEETLLVLGPCR